MEKQGTTTTESGQKKLKRRKKLKRPVDPREVGVEELGEAEQMQRSVEYAGDMLRKIPRTWLQESSVLREAVGLTPVISAPEPTHALPGGDTPLLESSALPTADAPALMDPNLGQMSAAVNGGAEYLTTAMSDLYSRMATLEQQAYAIRQTESDMKPSFDSSEAYLKVMQTSPSGAEALVWLDELETLRPEWITSAHYEVAMLLAVEPGAPVPERDVLIIFLKCRQRHMATSVIYEHLFARLGYSSLREVAFPMLFHCLKHDFGDPLNDDLSGIPANVCKGIFMNMKASNNTPRAIATYIELSKAHCQIGIEAYLEIVTLLARGSYGAHDQDVLDFMIEELQNETAAVLEHRGLEGIPPTFFAKALAGCGADAAIRLWHFMKDHGIRVTVEDYVNLVSVMCTEERIYEAEEIMRYLEANHAEYLWMHDMAIPKAMLRLYATNNVKYKLALPKEGNFPEQSNALSIFSEYFGPESGTPPQVSPYISLIKSTDDEKLVHELWREMLSLGLQLETKHYNAVFRGMGGKIGTLSSKIEYAYPASPLDEEIPAHLQRAMAEHEQKELTPVMPPLQMNTETSFSPFESSLVPGGSDKNVLTPTTQTGLMPVPSLEQYQELTEAFHAKVCKGL